MQYVIIFAFILGGIISLYLNILLCYNTVK